MNTIYLSIGIFSGTVCLIISVICLVIVCKKYRQNKILQKKNKNIRHVSLQSPPEFISDPINPTGSTNLSKMMSSLNTAVFADATSRKSIGCTTDPLPHELLSHKNLSKVMEIQQEMIETGKVPIKKLKKVRISPMSSVSSNESYDMNPVFFDNQQKKRISREYFSKAITKYPKLKKKLSGEDPEEE